MVTKNNELSFLVRLAVNEAYTEIPICESATVDPNSNDNTENQRSIVIAKSFISLTCPEFLSSPISHDDDRLVKVGRAIKDLLEAAKSDEEENVKQSRLEASLALIVEECIALASGSIKVPKVQFGKTNLEMPIVTLGCMRFQQSWMPGIKMDGVADDCQENLKNIISYAVKDLGINHIETARGYGSSEVQIGEILKKMFDDGEIKREELIIQVKVGAKSTAKEFRGTLETSFKNLKLNYVDLFSFHGVNMEKDFDFIFNNGENGNCYDVVEEYIKAGKIRHVGFTSHGRVDLIRRVIETDKFDYANIHYHAFGSYTASGEGETAGNLQNIRLMNEKNMGVFIISPYDKGGRLYAPSRKLRSLTLPDLEPLAYGSSWLWNHGELVDDKAHIHTIVCGAARPSDLDQPAIGAFFHQERREDMIEKTRKVTGRLHQAALDVLGERWMGSWHIGLHNCSFYDEKIQFGQIVGLYNILKAYGMLGYCKDRYGTFEGNSKSWDINLSSKENIEKLGGWGWMPGCDTDPKNDYIIELENVPIENKEQVLEALRFVQKYCSKNCDATIPKEWETAYDMRPWNAYPERS
uniref:NADP-dependent oxidoreductase domain-containing protein n=1 Tax=Eucampia antarctica TaxID=49252 RepID=A0A7S2R028_9STRA|mmetsp:Transcript_11373/g.10885  ORF Transcript_11373/g.10885 Transcript_11373/m.10885 type:complete len:581 (+) Transcript_11373:117-1859(+)|eukprot:CAMPEP_0197835088 /NCGR_PEP_ID=MMETSP1437-20131217/24681_1 /TAXON_ID=49252 ORGANISM="Eucampia antarctica, Strain CCMP1452" /NCGR_SAMPLE_ID=MMETSP1437 /ASSEMBLY_ACC=CAM_ASM_001096 /LENGTH=580 /DNA_ID=CAMNT_0043440263 /DNA_START=111 /DNA_END=1853 /DNA_ORIENTATION=+